jgi:hypothetical protein
MHLSSRNFCASRTQGKHSPTILLGTPASLSSFDSTTVCRFGMIIVSATDAREGIILDPRFPCVLGRGSEGATSVVYKERRHYLRRNWEECPSNSMLAWIYEAGNKVVTGNRSQFDSLRRRKTADYVRGSWSGTYLGAASSTRRSNNFSAT